MQSLEAMQKKAVEIGIQKGAVVVFNVEEGLHFLPIGGDFFRQPDPVNRGEQDKGTNYLAFAIGKIMQSMRTGQASCQQYAMKGESPARGCVVDKSSSIYFACSGGTEDEDVVVANSGKELHDKD